ncbi:MAG: sulfotransferase domain-containing protein [Roseococcus sp.]|nr:sulfotransferase domain-containing protein [Roseococcus sp.]
MVTLSTIRFCDVPFQVADDPARPPLFVFGVRKSGSSIMNMMVEALAQMNGMNFVDVAGRLFEAGVGVERWRADPGILALLRGGNVYGGFRNAPSLLLDSPFLTGGRSILLVRDPRDALVSEYFSNAFSHAVPEAGEAREEMLTQRAEALSSDVAAYVLHAADSFREALRQYLPFLALPGLRLYRYESAILDKRAFLRDVCAHFGWPLAQSQLEAIMAWADVIPGEENPRAFVRKVTPGDHREKLSAAVIAELDAFFREEMRVFGYA